MDWDRSVVDLKVPGEGLSASHKSQSVCKIRSQNEFKVDMFKTSDRRPIGGLENALSEVLNMPYPRLPSMSPLNLWCSNFTCTEKIGWNIERA